VPASLAGGDGTLLGTLVSDNATSFPQYDETTDTCPSEKDERETNVRIMKDNQATPSTPFVEGKHTTPLPPKARR
jgi:hypothetical protein